MRGHPPPLGSERPTLGGYGNGTWGGEGQPRKENVNVAGGWAGEPLPPGGIPPCTIARTAEGDGGAPAQSPRHTHHLWIGSSGVGRGLAGSPPATVRALPGAQRRALPRDRTGVGRAGGAGATPSTRPAFGQKKPRHPGFGKPGDLALRSSMSRLLKPR